MCRARKKDLIILISVNVFIVAFAVFYKLIFDTDTPISECAAYKAISLPCPGCGGSRAVFALFELRPVSSFLFYPPLFVAIAIILRFDIRALVHVIKPKGKAPSVSLAELIIFACSVVLFFTLRIVLLLGFGVDLINIASCLSF